MPNKRMLWLHTICNHHDHPTAGHFGETKTTELVHHKFHWPGLRCMVKDYVRSCTSCVCTKAPCHKPYSLLKQLPIPGQPWESISMDFIKQLPLSEGFTVILVIMDRLTKQSLFIPTHNMVDAPQLAQLFLTHVFSKHRAPGHVTSNCSTEFMSHFFWAPLLPLAEFTYNNAASTTTGISPFFANKGYHLRLMTNLLAPSSSSKAQHYVVDLDQLHDQLKVSITEAQECYQKAVDTITSLQGW